MRHSKFFDLRRRTAFLLSGLLLVETFLSGFAIAASPALTATQTIANAVAVDQVETVVLPRTLVTGDTVSLTVFGQTVSQSFVTDSSSTLSALAFLASGIPNVIAAYHSFGNTLVLNLLVANSVPAKLTITRTPVAPVTTVASASGVAQVDTATLPNLFPGDTVSTTVNGHPASATYSGSESGTLAAFAAAIDAAGTGVTASFSGLTLSVTALVSGSGFVMGNIGIVGVTNATVSAPFTPAVAQVVDFAVSGTASGWIFRATVNGKDYDFLAASGATDTIVASGLEGVIASDTGAAVTAGASASGATHFALTAKSPGIPFTFAASTINSATGSTSSGSTSSGSTSSGSTSSGSTSSGSTSTGSTSSGVSVPITVSTLPATVNALTFTVTGSASPNAAIVVSRSVIGFTGTLASLTGSADASGAWTVSAPLVPNAVNVLTFTEVGGTGSVSLAVTEDSIAPTVTLSTSSGTVAASGITLMGTTEPFARLSILGGATTATGTASGSGTFGINVPLNPGVANHLVVTATDAAGNF